MVEGIAESQIKKDPLEFMRRESVMEDKPTKINT